ncbi:MAG: hypothetical protein SGILL_006403 [Bacillariaceae sp.]
MSPQPPPPPDISGRIDAALQERAQREQQGQFMNFVNRYGLNLLFPAQVIPKDTDSSSNKTTKSIKTNKDLINARLLENGILFEDLQSLPQLQEGVAQSVDNLMRTQAFHSVQIEIDKNPGYVGSGRNISGVENSDNETENTIPIIQQQLDTTADDYSATHPHLLKVILDEKNWYSLYIGGGIKHEGMEEAMSSSGSKLPKAQFETSVTFPNLTGYLDRTLFQYTVDQTTTSRFLLSHERPLYSWFPEDSAISQNILATLKGSQYSLGIRALVDTVDYESSRSYKEYQRLVQWRLDNTGNVAQPQMAPGLYWGIDWTLGCLRDVVPRKHPTLPYAADASPEIVAQSGSSLQHSLKWEVRTNGSLTDDKFQPTVGVDAYFEAEVAGPPGDVGYAKAQGGNSIHVPLSEYLSLHATCAGGILRDLSFNGLCRSPTISDRFFVGGPMQLRGFLPAGIGPRSKRGGKTTPGGDAMGGNLFYTASLAASMVPPSGILADYGIRLFAFGNAGTLVGTHQNIGLLQIAKSTRASAGFGISGGTPMGRVELTYAWPLRYGPRDARRNLQFGFGLSYG